MPHSEIMAFVNRTENFLSESLFYLKETINFASFSTKRPAVGALKFPKKTFPEDTIAKYHH